MAHMPTRAIDFCAAIISQPKAYEPIRAVIDNMRNIAERLDIVDDRWPPP